MEPTVRPLSPLVSCLIIFVFSLFCLLWYGGQQKDSVTFSKEGVKTIATITNVGRRGGGHKSPSSSYIDYQFVTPDKKSFVGSASIYSGEVGETVLIEYNRKTPAHNRVAGSGLKPKKSHNIFIILGYLIMLVSLGGVIFQIYRALASKRL